MKGLLITSKGIEDVAAIEVKELIGSACRIGEGCIIFNLKKPSDLCLLCYKSQSADRVVYLIESFDFTDFFADFKDFIAKLKLEEWIERLKRFRVECIRIGTHSFKSVDAERKFIDAMAKKGFTTGNSDFEIIFLIYIINNKCHIGIDFAGFEMNKRSYKVHLHPNSCRGTIAYALLREANFKPSETLLDPFSRDGVIPIEAALYASGFPCNYYKKSKFAFLRLNIGFDTGKFFSGIDKKIRKGKTGIYSYDHLFKYVDYSRKNSKIAGVEKNINFSRTELEWLDIKFRKESVDRIVTRLPESRNANLGKIYSEFFYQSEYILKGTGRIALLSRIPNTAKQYAAKHDFILLKEKKIWSGSEELSMLLLKKKSI